MPQKADGTNYKVFLRVQRENRNMSQKDVARQSKGLLTSIVVSNIETGKTLPTIQHLWGFCHAFDVTFVTLSAMKIPENYEDLLEQKSMGDSRPARRILHKKRKKYRHVYG